MHPLLSETEATLMFQQTTYIDACINFVSVTCSPHNAETTDTNVLVNWYWLSAKRPTIGWYRLAADYRCISKSTDLAVNSRLNRAVDQKTGCWVLLTHHPCIQQEPPWQRTTCVGQSQTLPADSATDDLSDLVASDPAADATWSVIAVPVGCSGWTAAASWPSVRPLAATCAAGAARMHTPRCTLSRRTQSQTYKCTNMNRLRVGLTT